MGFNGLKEVTQCFSNAEGKNLSTQNPILAKMSFENEGKIKLFSDEGKLKEFDATRPILKND